MIITETQADKVKESKQFQRLIQDNEKKLGSVLLHKGMKIFEVSEDLVIREVVYDTLYLNGDLSIARKRLTLKKDKVYIKAINYENAYRKLMKKINGN